MINKNTLQDLNKRLSYSGYQAEQLKNGTMRVTESRGILYFLHIKFEGGSVKVMPKILWLPFMYMDVIAIALLFYYMSTMYTSGFFEPFVFLLILVGMAMTKNDLNTMRAIASREIRDVFESDDKEPSSP